MISSSHEEKVILRKGRKSLALVTLMVTSIMLSAVPSTYASHTTQYGVQRDPLHISIGDLNCDGFNDIVSGSGMGHFITILLNDGNGGFADRQDIQISNNDSYRAGFVDVADGNRVEIADATGDGVNDIIYYQQNVRFVGESFVRPANLTVVEGDCNNPEMKLWDQNMTVTIVDPYLQAFDVADVNGDGSADVVMSTIDAAFSRQTIQIYKGPDFTLPSNFQSFIVPLTTGQYTALKLGQWGEDLQTDPFTGNPIPGECEDLDIWMIRTPPFNTGVGYSRGTYDNMTVIEYDCLQERFAVPDNPADSSKIHDFTLDAEHSFPLYDIDIADNSDDDNDRIDLIAAVDGITGRVSYATRSATSSQWDTQNYVSYGPYLGASVTIADVNQDGKLDFFVPTSITLLDTQESNVQNQTYLLRPNLRATNTVQIVLADPSGNGYQTPLSFDVGRRPTMAMPGQLQGGEGSALEVVIGQQDYSYRFSNNAMWLDTQGYAGQGDYLSVLSLDNHDLGITHVTIEPSVKDPATFQSIVGEGNRWVNVTVKNTGLMPIDDGSLNVNLQVREVLGGTDTIVYHNDFESPTANIGSSQFAKYSYTGEYSAGDSSWHIDEDRFWESGVTYLEGDVVNYNNTDYECGNNNTTSCTTVPSEDNSSWAEVFYLPWEVEANPSNYYWVGVNHQYTDDEGETFNATGYYNHMDEGLILEDVDLSGADAAFLDMDAICSAGFFQLFLLEPYDIIERWLYEDSCSVEVWSDGTGWETVWRFGGWDNERKYRIEERVSSAPDPEYNDYNGDYYGDWHSTLWNNYTERGGLKDSCYMPFLAFGFPFAECWPDGELDQKADTIDLTPYAGQVVDIRFRFRSGLEGTVGPEGSADDSGLDGFAFDNITIRKRDVTFGNSTDVTLPVTNLDLVAGESFPVTLTADFVDNTTYYVSTSLTSADLGNGQVDQDATNDQQKFQLTVRNLYDPGLVEEPWLDLENGEKYASGERPITIGVQNWGNTVVDFEVEARVSNALPQVIAIEDFSGTIQPIWEDDGNGNGTKLDDSSESNEMLPQNQGVFKNDAYWLGHPSDGYGDSWNETLTLEPIPISDDGADFTFLTFDYYAESNYISDNFGNVQSVRDFAFLEATWSRGGEVYEGVIYGSWTDMNENGLRPAINPGSNTLYHYCEDFDLNGLYDEVQYAGDHSGGVGEPGWVEWFDTDEIVSTARIDLTHVHLLNRTNPDSFYWTDECTSLAGADLTLTWRFFSNDDDINGNAGYAGFGIDNIRVSDYTFYSDGNYTESVTGMDAAQTRTIEMGVKDFERGLYRIDLMTNYNNSDPSLKWFEKPEISTANNFSTILFEIANADITLLQPDVLDCVADVTYQCAYPTSPSTQENHDFAVPLLNGVIEGLYSVTMKIVDEETGQTVFEQPADNSPFLLDPHQRAQANWSSPYYQWMDGHTYNISFYSNLVVSGEFSGNERYFPITFYDHIDVAILSNPTDQSRLQRVKSDLDSMGMTYTQFQIENWGKYGTNDWLDVSNDDDIKGYSKVLLPWQTDYNVEYGQYYEKMAESNPENAELTLTEVLTDYMRTGGTVQLHLGPYRTYYDAPGQSPYRLPFDIDIVMRDFVNSTEDRRIKSGSLEVIDPFHPILSGLEMDSFSGVNGGSHVALSGLYTEQVNQWNMPDVCIDGAIGSDEKGRISEGGTFHSLIVDEEFPTQSLLSVCSYQSGGIIVTTIDVENPSVSQAHGDANFPLLSNLLSYHVTPYPDGFEVAREGFHMTINGEVPEWSSQNQTYKRMPLKSNASLDFSFVTNVPGIHADWVIESNNDDQITGWDGQTLGEDNWHVHQSDPSVPVSTSFCVQDANEPLGCKINAEWTIWLFLHDDEGHTRITNITVYTNDEAADTERPIAFFDIIHDSTSAEFLELIGSSPVPTGTFDENNDPIMVDAPKYRVRLSETATTEIKFTAANSSDEGTGIKSFQWSVYNDGDSVQEYNYPGTVDEWSYVFRNSTPAGVDILIELKVFDFRNQDSRPTYRVYFEVVGELFGDEAPQANLDSFETSDGERFDALDSVEIINITGTVVDNDQDTECDVKVEVALDDKSIFDASQGERDTLMDMGRYDKQEGLCDGDEYTLSLNVSHMYTTDLGGAGIVYFRMTEGNYVIEDNIPIFTLPISEETETVKEEADSLSPVVMGAAGALVLIGVVAMTMLLRGRGKEAIEDAVESFGGVEQMDPVEAYVQQLVGQGYEEQMARQYAQQYYASYYDQQKGQGG